MPQADWCEHCTKGKGKERDHKRLEHERAIIQLDHSHLKSDGSEGVEDAAEVILAAVDWSSGLTLAMSLPTKNFEMKYAQKTLNELVHWAARPCDCGGEDRRRADVSEDCERNEMR